MANMNKKTRDFLYPLVVAQQGGEYCVLCDRDKEDLKADGHKPEFCIDVDDNSGNHSKSNLRMMQLACHSCNTKKNHPSMVEPFTRSATPEMITGKKYESDFRRWVLGQYMENENIGLEYSYLVNSGAEEVGCSPETIKRYLAKMTSKAGMYEWFDKMGSTVMVIKKEFKSD